MGRPDFARHIQRFRETGQGVTLAEVPAVLDALLDLRSHELMQLVGLLGLSYNALQTERRVARGPATAREVLRVLSGAAMGRGPELPTSVNEVIAEIRRLDSARPRVHGEERQRLERQRMILCEVGQRLLHLKDLPWTSKLGLQVSGNLNLRVAQPLKRGTDEGGLLPLRDLPLPNPVKRVVDWGRPALNLQRGIIIGQKDRHGRRRIEQWTLTGLGSAVGGVNHAFKESGREWGGSIKFPYVSVGKNPIRGRGISMGVPLIGGVNIAERFIGVALFPHVFAGGGMGSVSAFGVRFLPSIDIGVTGDALQHVTQPIANGVENAYRRLTRATRRRSR